MRHTRRGLDLAAAHASLARMGMHVIENITVERDAVDRLHWRVCVATDFFGTWQDQAFAFQWEGVAAFYRGAPAGQRLQLAAAWANREQSARMRTPGQTRFEFVTELSPNALDRIEEFRSGGRLHGRIEGKLFFVYRDGPEGNSGGSRVPGRVPWVTELVTQMNDFGRSMAADIRTEPFELTRDLWCQEVLGKLRPPDRYVLEVQVPLGTADGAAGRRALAHIDEARRAFDEGRWSEVARVCYRSVEELQQVMDRVEARYGSYARGRIREQAKELRSLCDPDRHGQRPSHDGLVFDRVLALHVLAMTRSLAGVVLP